MRIINSLTPIHEEMPDLSGWRPEETVRPARYLHNSSMNIGSAYNIQGNTHWSAGPAVKPLTPLTSSSKTKMVPDLMIGLSLAPNLLFIILRVFSLPFFLVSLGDSEGSFGRSLHDDSNLSASSVVAKYPFHVGSKALDRLGPFVDPSELGSLVLGTLDRASGA